MIICIEIKEIMCIKWQKVYTYIIIYIYKSIIKAKQNLRAADKACARKKKKYDVICAQNGLKFQVPTNHF